MPAGSVSLAGMNMRMLQQSGDESGLRTGLPRPRLDGLPVPWITRVTHGVPQWKRVLLDRILQCQVDWLCQVCGQQLPRWAWVALGPDGIVLSDAAVHHECMRMARRWCPHLRNPASHVELVEVDQVHICVDSTRLDHVVDYGDEIKPWIVTRPVTNQFRQFA